MSVWNEPFGRLADGSAVTAWHLENDGLRCVLLDYGAAVQSLLVPVGGGGVVDVVLGYDTPGAYERESGFMGATIGRVGNRIGGASFRLGGKTYALAQNNGRNHLHGGIRGFDKHLWRGEAAGGHAVCFSRLSPDGEEGYPGNLRVRVTYDLSNGALHIRYEAVTDADTPVSLTNHSYFNLNGHGSVLGHSLCLAAERFTENDAGCLPTGRLLRVEGTPFDFRQPKPIGRDIEAEDLQLRYGGGYDHNFVLTGAREAAVLVGEESGLRMSMETDLPGVQVYSGNNLTPRVGKGGARYDRRCGLCLETQLFPNAMACYGFPSPLLRAGQTLRTETIYRFSAM